MWLQPLFIEKRAKKEEKCSTELIPVEMMKFVVRKLLVTDDGACLAVCTVIETSDNTALLNI